MVENVGVRRVNPLKEKTVLWNKSWHEAGCPSTGVLSQLKEHAKATYKYTVRRLEWKENLLRCRRCPRTL